ncbi:hypothetical protein [Flavobacterium sp.]
MKKKNILIIATLVLVVLLAFLYPRMKSISDAQKYSPEEYKNK